MSEAVPGARELLDNYVCITLMARANGKHLPGENASAAASLLSPSRKVQH
jgi:hypothetical protein